MKLSVKKGLSFGLASGIITTLGLMVGLNSTTHSAFVVIGGIIVIAIADALSDAVGIHVSEEAENKHTTREIWEATAATFFSKFVFALTFIVPVLLLPLSTAIVVSVVWGLSLLTIASFYIARKEKIEPYRAILEHLVIAVAVIVITHYVGAWVAGFFV
jgi:VIT1/CCC1 family predicted Fe2+/Mn2+ transporter